MAIEVYRAFSIVDGDIVEEMSPPRRAMFLAGNVVGVLTNLPAADGSGPSWEVEITIGSGPGCRRVRMLIERFLTIEQYRRSSAEPWCFSELDVKPDPKNYSSPADADLRWLWLFRDAMYVSERNPRPSETAEVVLRIKSLHFQRDEEFKRLKEQVANFEAIDANSRSGSVRKAIPDDVKLLVWSRDGGACVKCGESNNLHFDHVIPLAKGGSDIAENIQLLCRACNLAKSDRLV